VNLCPLHPARLCATTSNISLSLVDGWLRVLEVGHLRVKMPQPLSSKDQANFRQLVKFYEAKQYKKGKKLVFSLSPG
jgi:hypothetical protein